MNIYFTSYGIDIRYSNYMNSYGDIINVLNGKKVAVIPNAKLASEDKDGVGHFYGHWKESQRIFDEFAIRHNIDKSISSNVSNLIYYHDINISKLGDDKLTEMIQKLGFEGVQQLFELKRADLLAQNEKYHYILDDYDKQRMLFLSKYKGGNTHE